MLPLWTCVSSLALCLLQLPKVLFLLTLIESTNGMYTGYAADTRSRMHTKCSSKYPHYEGLSCFDEHECRLPCFHSCTCIPSQPDWPIVCDSDGRLNQSGLARRGVRLSFSIFTQVPITTPVRSGQVRSGLVVRQWWCCSEEDGLLLTMRVGGLGAGS